KGEIFGFLGPSGAGKSTTQKILMGLNKEYTGEITVADYNLNDISDDYYEIIGVSFELPNHFLKLTGLENLQYFNSLYANTKSKEEIIKLFELVGLENAIHTKVSEYSKGMKSRLNVIRSILHNPSILFLDEPTTGLDPVNAKKIKDLILSLKNEGKTIFLATHDMVVAEEVCDRIAIIVDGKINIIDTPKNLKLAHGEKSVIVEYGNGKLKTEKFNLSKLGENTKFLDLIKNNEIKTIHSQEANLSKVFINITGRKLI
ncbi:MAG: ABC transporter ATP-binding protein, partial [Candidatus Heimdallarchaeota archaeon]|nr:ABC transporter ATP-binding protein [Candidatus Heimdallarchaeota archaeon]